MNRLQLLSLANHLAAYISVGSDESGCDHTLRRTIGWIDDHNLERGKVLEWLQRRGGWCDCSVVGNICLASRDDHHEHTPPPAVPALYTRTSEE